MRRLSAFAVVCGAYLASLGCHHVGGKCDCVNTPVPGSCNYYTGYSSTSAVPAGPVQAMPEVNGKKEEKKPIMPLPADKKLETPKIDK